MNYLGDEFSEGELLNLRIWILLKSPVFLQITFHLQLPKIRYRVLDFKAYPPAIGIFFSKYFSYWTGIKVGSHLFLIIPFSILLWSYILKCFIFLLHLFFSYSPFTQGFLPSFLMPEPSTIFSAFLYIQARKLFPWPQTVNKAF